MNILCRLGLHWGKPVYRPGYLKFDWLEFESRTSSIVRCWTVWKMVSRKCRRCGKRVAL